MLKQSNRLHGASTVTQILKEGDFKKTPFFALRRIENDSGQNRYGIVLSTKLEKSAVKRNEKRRKVYAALAELQKEAKVPTAPTYDTVILFRRPGLKLDYQDLKPGHRKTHYTQNDSFIWINLEPLSTTHSSLSSPFFWCRVLRVEIKMWTCPPLGN